MERYYSSIFWHFLGSPNGIDWHTIFSPSDIITSGKSPKPSNECFKILKSIIQNSYLKANATEKIIDEYETDKFCCLTDIPFKDLIYQKRYYGPVAIGFNSQWVYKSFRPVLYFPKAGLPTKKTLEKTTNGTAIVNPYTTTAGEMFIQDVSQYAKSVITSFKSSDGKDNRFNTYWLNYVKVTNYSENPKETFYREREWRKIGDAPFEKKDITAIIVPKSIIEKTFKFIRENKMTIDIITWDTVKKA